MQTTKILAVLGMPGSGKSQVIKYLKNKYQLPNVYLGQATFDKIKEDNLEINPENEKIAREKLRKKYGMASHAILALPKIEKYIGKTTILLLESMYSWEEYLLLKEKYNENFFTLAIYSSPKTRAKRLKNRKKRPLKNKQEFLNRDYLQIENLNQAGPIAIANHTIINEGSIEDLNNNIEKTLEILKLKQL